MKTFYIASDHAGFELKDFTIKSLEDLDCKVIDLGPNSDDRVDYPDFAKKCADAVVSDEGSFGTLLCGTGIGISIAANKVQGIRAALCHNKETATLSREHNDANILCFGARLLDKETIKEMIQAFVLTDFEGGRHAQRVGKIEICSIGKVE